MCNVIVDQASVDCVCDRLNLKSIMEVDEYVTFIDLVLELSVHCRIAFY